MDKHENKGFLTFVFLLLWILDGCFGENLFHVGGLGIYYHLPIMSLIIAVGGLAFLVSPRLGRAQVLAIHGAVLLLPVVFTVGWSGFVWIINLSSVSEIRRGIVRLGYIVFGILAIASTAYVVGERTVWIYMASLLVANLQIIIFSIITNGFVPFLEQFWELIITFAGTTGDIMQRLEIHNITYGLGAFLVYFFVKGRDFKKVAFLIPIVFVCYLTGLKRISIIAAIAGILLGHLFRLLRKYPSAGTMLLKLLGACFLIGALAYVWAVHAGFYDYLESVGIDTNGRAEIYRGYEQYYSMSPAFLGHGTGWSDNLFRDIREGIVDVSETVSRMPHNDYMKMYLELGMIGFLIWCYLECNMQVKQAFHFLGQEGGIVALALFGYLAVTFLTDPTSTQIHVNCAIVSILLSYRLSVREEWYERKMEEKNRQISEFTAGGLE